MDSDSDNASTDNDNISSSSSSDDEYDSTECLSSDDESFDSDFDIDDMYESDLEKYEKYIAKRIKRRREEIKKEAISHVTCPICKEIINGKSCPCVITSCGHVFCAECYIKHISIINDMKCPVCRSKWKGKELLYINVEDVTIDILRKAGARVSIS
jgi:rubrerythrin